MTARKLTKEESEERQDLFGDVRDGLRPLRSYLWTFGAARDYGGPAARAAGDSGHTMPGVRTPIRHVVRAVPGAAVGLAGLALPGDGATAVRKRLGSSRRSCSTRSILSRGIPARRSASSPPWQCRRLTSGSSSAGRWLCSHGASMSFRWANMPAGCGARFAGASPSRISELAVVVLASGGRS